MLISKTVQDFVEKFEREFSNYLVAITEEEKVLGHFYTTFHEIKPASNGKFSDWDIFCHVNKSNIFVEVLVKMDLLIKSFPGFLCVRNFESPKDHYIAFMPNEESSPFIDIHITKVEPEILQEFRAQVCKEGELERGTSDWTKIIHWRKKQNGGDYKQERLVNLASLQENYSKIVEFLS